MASRDQDDTIAEIQKLLEAYSLDTYVMVSAADDVIERHKKQTEKGLGDLRDE